MGRKAREIFALPSILTISPSDGLLFCPGLLGNSQLAILLLGDVEGESILTTTMDPTPELKFLIPPGWSLASVTITDGVTEFGPYSLVGDIASVTDELPSGSYSIVGTPGLDAESNPVPVAGILSLIIIETVIAYGNSLGIAYGRPNAVSYQVGQVA